MQLGIFGIWRSQMHRQCNYSRQAHQGEPVSKIFYFHTETDHHLCEWQPHNVVQTYECDCLNGNVEQERRTGAHLPLRSSSRARAIITTQKARISGGGVHDQAYPAAAS